MASDRTMVTELATALGTLGFPDLPTALAARPYTLRITASTWDRLAALKLAGGYAADFDAAYCNGQAFAAAADGLGGRPPRVIEWTGGRRPIGDEVAPIDLAIDHVYLLSCKYLSANISNPSPARIFEGLLATTGTWERTDWYSAIAPEQHQDLYLACRGATGLQDLPDRAVDLTSAQRHELSRALPGRRYPDSAQQAYRRLCRTVSDRSAELLNARLARSGAHSERFLWRLLRIGNAPYFLLGTSKYDSVRMRIATTWDWRLRYKFVELVVTAGQAGQPQVDWTAYYLDRTSNIAHSVSGHVEIRWSHGRFRNVPEAKIYLDTPLAELPGYHPLS